MARVVERPEGRGDSNLNRGQIAQFAQIRLASRLSTAEYAVARYLIEGKTYGEMAALRGTSIRTVANQICSMFRKLGVSGRAELAGLVADIAIEGDDSCPRSQEGMREAIGVTLDLERGDVYYTSGASGRVGRANLDGSDAHDLVTGSGALTGTALAQLPSH